MTGTIPQKREDAPVLARTLAMFAAARPGEAWRQTELARALGWTASRVAEAASVLRRRGVLDGRSFALRAGVELPAQVSAARVAITPAASIGLRRLREMAVLHRRSMAQALSHADSERLGELVLAEERVKRLRPTRMAELREELDLLEALEIAEKGPAGLPEPRSGQVDMAQRQDGAWVPSERAAA